MRTSHISKTHTRRLAALLSALALTLISVTASAQSVPTPGGGAVNADNLNTASQQPTSGLVMPNSDEVKRAQGSSEEPTPVKSADEATVPLDTLTVTP